ncbi:hypothetical protein ENSA7_01140 [Enhygromyxa salina]|uniref:Uncharacterized protein n=1 Tax=Enhygromyxa salina TaxID=215803 RepID=A0A2S9YYI6_9BACT|nr:hypothetical protein ENSA7_01140 [Enhygromyxa salina]
MGVGASPTPRWVLEACTSDAIPNDGRLALDWSRVPQVEPSLPTESVTLELHRPRPDNYDSVFATA